MRTQTERIFEVDILRFIAAIAVLFFHATFRGQFYEIYTFSFPFLSSFTKYGFLGIDLFFIISGFVILMSAQNKSPKAFVKSRFIRLYPSFWFGVTFVAIVCYLWGSAIFTPNFWQYIINMTMLGGFLGVKDIDGVYWTLYVELKFYIFIFLLMLAGRIKHILIFLFLWACLAFLDIFINIPWKIQSLLIINWAHYFVAGCLFYLIRRDGLNKLYAVFLAFVYIISMLRLDTRMEGIANTYNTEFSTIIAYLIVSAIFLVMGVIALRMVSFSKYSKTFVLLGSLSYPIYLLHHNAGFIYMEQMQAYMNKYVILVTLFAWVIGLSYLVTLYEKWLANKLKHAIERF